MQTLESTINGVPQPPRRYKMIWSIDRDTITETDPDGFAARTYRYSLDLGQSPGTIDLTVLNIGLTLHALYKLDGEDLTVCMGVERPRDFEDRPDRGQFRLLFHRESRAPAQLAPECPNAPGCYWTIEPKGAVPGSTHSNGIDLITRKDPQGALVVTLAYVTRSQGDARDSSTARSPSTTSERAISSRPDRGVRADPPRSPT